MTYHDLINNAHGRVYHTIPGRLIWIVRSFEGRERKTRIIIKDDGSGTVDTLDTMTGIKSTTNFNTKGELLSQ